MDRPGGEVRVGRLRRWPAALAVTLSVAALGTAACGGGGDEPAAPSSTVPQAITDLARDLQRASEGLGAERSAQVVAAIQQAINEVVAAATARGGNPMTPEEMNALFRAKMAEAGVPLP